MPLEFDVFTGLNTENSALLQQDTRQRIQKIFADSVPQNQLAPILPSGPSAVQSNNDPYSGLSQSERSDLAISRWMAATAKDDKDLLSRAGTESQMPAAGTGRYLSEKYGYNPARQDNDDFYADQQQWYTELPKAVLLKLPLLVATKTGTGLGYLAGLADPGNWNSGYITNAADNAFARFFENVEENVKNKWLTTFQESSDRDKGFFSRAISDLNFWTEDVIDGAAFMASAFVPGLTLSKLGTGVRAASLLSRLGIAAENGVLGKVGLENMAAYMKNAQTIANGIDKTLIVSLNTASEAMWEAKGVRDNIITGFSSKVNPATGRNYTDSEARQIAGEAAMNTFLFNVAALSVSNLWETNLLYKALGKSDNAALRLTGNRLGKGYEAIKAATLAEKIFSSRAGTIGKNALAGIAVEGAFEENIQLAIQRNFEQNGKYKGGVLNQYLYQTIDALKGDDTETAMNIGLGAILGMVGGGIGANREYNRQQRQTSALTAALEQGEKDFLSFGDIFRRDDQGNIRTDKRGKPLMDIAKLASVTAGWREMSNLKDLNDSTSNEVLVNIYKNEQLARWAKAHFDSGKSDLIYSKLDDATRYTDKELIELGYDPTSNPDRVAEVTAMKAYVRSLQELDETLDADILKPARTAIPVYQARKNYLFNLGARQLSLQQQSEVLSSRIAGLRQKINLVTGIHPNDILVDQLNSFRDRITQQKSLLQALSGYDLDGSETNIAEEEKYYADLQKQEQDFIKFNKNEVDLLSVNPDGRYLYQDDTKNRAILNLRLQKSSKELAAITNSVNSVNGEFYRVADIDNGEKYFIDQIRPHADKIKQELQQAVEAGRNTGEQTPTGKKLKVLMANNTNGGPEIEVEIEEGRRYLGKMFSKSVAANNGLRKIFNNDNIKILKIDDNGNITLTINGDAAVTFTKEEFRQIPAIKGFDTLTPLQKFYINHRNTAFTYRVPVKYSKSSKNWETRLVNGRLSYNKKEDILELVYLENGKTKRIEFNRRFVAGQFDLTTLSEDDKRGLQEQQKKLDKQKAAQIQLFEDLINDTESQIEQQKERTTAVQKRISDLDDRMQELGNELADFKRSFETADQTKINDKRSKASKLSRLIEKTEAEISEVRYIREEMNQEMSGLIKRRTALEFFLDQYYTGLDEILSGQLPLSRIELDYHSSRLGELQFQEAQVGTINETTAQIQDLLEATDAESQLINDNIKRLQAYEELLSDHLRHLLQSREVLQLLLDHPQKDEFRTWLKHIIRQETNPERITQYRRLLNKLSSDPSFYEDLSWLAGGISDSRKQIDDLVEKHQHVLTRLNQATYAFELRAEINQTSERINLLKDIFTGLTNQFKRNKASAFYQEIKGPGVVLASARTIEDAKRLHELEDLFSPLLTEPGDPLQEEAVLFSDSATPVMTLQNNPLFKTADSHFPGNVLSEQEYTRRFFKFTSQVSITPDLFLMPVTAANDGQFSGNIRYTSDLAKYPDDIKLVVFRKMSGKYYPVDMTGNILQNPDTENIVYSSMYGHQHLLSGERDKMIAWARKNFVTETLTDDHVHDKLTEYLLFREWIKDQVIQGKQIFIPLTGKSNGIQNREPKDLISGRPQQLGVEGRITPASPSWENIDMVVSTTDGQITGSTGVKIKPGRVVIRRNGNIIQVYNRLLIAEEKERIKRILKRLTQLIGKKNEYDNLKQNGMKLSSQEEMSYSVQINQAKLYTQYLSSILYWRGPKEGTTASPKQWYISKGLLFKGDISIPFTIAELDNNIDSLLEGVYHQVASVLLNETYKNNEYNVLDVGKDGELVIAGRYNSYKEYLLTGENRTADKIPVYTNIVVNDPLNPALPQLKNSYLRFSPNSEDQAYQPVKHVKDTIFPINKEVKALPGGSYKLTFENSKGTVSIDVILQKSTEFKVVDIIGKTGELTANRKELMEFFVNALNYPDEKNFQDEDEQGNEINITGLEVINDYLKKGSKIILLQQSEGKSGNDHSTISASSQEVIASTNTPSQLENQPPAPVPPATQGPVSDAQSILNDLNFLDGSGFNVDYRIAHLSREMIQLEDLEKVREWFQHNLPQFDIKTVNNLIDGKAWGAFRNGAIYLYDKAERGTGYHEAFEAVYASFLTPEEKQSLIQEYKSRPGYQQLLLSLKDFYPLHNEDQLIKEALAEEFREYILSTEKPVIKGQPKRNGFFRRLWTAIKAVLGLSVTDTDKINDLFVKISSGYFSAFNMLEAGNNTTQYRQVGTVSQEILGYTMEGIISLFFSRLWQNNQNTDALLNKKLSGELVNTIWKEIGGQLRGTWSLTAMKVAAIQLGILTSDQAKQPDLKVAELFRSMPAETITKIQTRVSEFEDKNIIHRKDQIAILSSFNTIVFENFSDYLKQFGFVLNREETDPNEEINPEDIENRERLSSDPLGIRDSLQVDTRNTASTAIRLLVASLTKDYYGPNNEIYAQKDPYLGLPRLVDYNSTLNILFSDLNNLVSVYRDGKLVSALEQMMEKLDQKYKDPATGRYRENYLWIDRLKRRIKFQDKYGERISEDSLTMSDIRLLVAFTRTFQKNRNIPSTLIIGEEAHIFDNDPVEMNLKNKVVEKWENNAKSTYQSNNDFIFLKNNEISFNKISQSFNALLNNSDPYKKLEFLKNIGIQFSLPDHLIVQGKYAKQFADSFDSIRLHLKEGGLIENFDDLFSKQIVNGPINTLIGIELDYQGEETSLQYRNPEGEIENSIIPPSCISGVLNSLSGVKNLRDFVLTNPQFGIVNDDGTVSLHTYQQNSLILKPGGLIFDNNGNKKRNIQFHLISGLSGLNEGDGISTAKLKQADKALQELYYLLKNWYYVVVNSDKTSEFALELGEFISMFNITSEPGIPGKVLDIYKDHLADEVNSLILLKNEIGTHIQYYADNQYDKSTGDWKLSHFRNIITSQPAISLLQKVINGEQTVPEFINSSVVDADIKKYLTLFIEQQQDSLLGLGIVKLHKDGSYSSKSLSKELLSKYSTQGLDLNPAGFSQVQFNNFAKYIFLNHQIAIREQHKLFYGHPALYKDLPKRSSGATAVKEAIVDDPVVLRWMDRNMPRTDGRIRNNGRLQTFHNISLQDNIVLAENYRQIAENLFTSILADTKDHSLAEIKVGARFDDQNRMTGLILDDGKFTGDIAAYINIVEADAQAYALPDFYRDLLFLSGKFTQSQNDQVEYELAYERDARARKPKGHPSFLSYSKEQINDNVPQQDREILARGNPHAILPVLKPQFFGYQENYNLQHTTFLKHSLQPKFYRMIEGTNFEKVYVSAQSKQIDVLGYESGQKVGNIYREGTKSFASIYLQDDGLELNSAPSQKLYTKYYGIQLETAASVKNTLVRGSQMTKLLLSNLFSEGKPLKSKYNQLRQDYFQTLKLLSKIGKTELLKELGIEQNQDGSYTTTDFRKMVTLLREEALKRDMPANIIEAFSASIEESATSMVYSFDSLSNREKIENILNALVDSRIISPKMHGKAAVQASVSLYEKLGTDRQILYLDENNIYQRADSYKNLTYKQQLTARISSSDLSFYKLENGKIKAMEIYLPHWFAEFYGREIDLKLLDERLLKAIGFRIPTQSLNFIDNIIVKGFLKQEEGDTVVVPSELVGKSSTDFDIDKLNIYLPNYYLEERGFDSISFKTFMKEDMINRGLKAEDADKILSSFTKDDFIRINRATYTNEGKIKKGSAFSIDQLTDKDSIPLVSFIKKSISNYNKTQPTRIKYIEPGDNTKEALQNKLIEISSSILELQENFRQLLLPSSAATLKSLASELSKLKQTETGSAIPFTQLTEWNYLNAVREQFLVAKQLVGIGAINVTSHVMSQLTGIMANETYKGDKVTLRFPHNTSNGKVSLGSVLSQDGRWISDLLSEALSAFVDAAKDPFVFTLNINPATAGTFFYLLRAGVSVDQVIYFLNQPAILNYLDYQRQNETLVNKVNQDEMVKNLIVAKTMSSFVDRAFPGIVKDPSGNDTTLGALVEDAISDEGEYDMALRSYIYPGRMNFFKQYKIIKELISKHSESIDALKKDDLQENIESYFLSKDKENIGHYSRSQSQYQLVALLDFLTYQEHARALADFMNGVNYDTYSSKNIAENKIQEFNFKKITEERFIINPEAIIENTFIGELKQMRESIPHMFESSFISLHPNAQSSFNRMYDFLNDPTLNISTDRKKDILNRFQNFFLTYVLQNVPATNPLTGKTEKISDFKSLLISNDSYAMVLAGLKKDIRYSKNKFIQQLYPLISTNRENFTDNIKLFISRQSSYEINELMDSITSLLEQRSENRQLQYFLDNLVAFAILQSGVQLSPITFSKVLPNLLYSNHVGNIIENFKSSTSSILNPDIVYKQFFQNNYNNQVLVPKITARMVTNDILYLPLSFINSSYDYLSVNNFNINPQTGIAYTRQEREDLIKNKKWDILFTKYLYEKFAQDDSTAYYRRINKLGNRMYAIESYTTDTSSMDENSIKLSGINGYVDERANIELQNKIKDKVSSSGTLTDPAGPEERSFIEDNTCNQ